MQIINYETLEKLGENVANMFLIMLEIKGIENRPLVTANLCDVLLRELGDDERAKAIEIIINTDSDEATTDDA